jgi:hypothetical protein
MVECTPLGTTVYEVTINDKTAALTDKFCPLIVMNKLSAPAFRADGLSMILGLFLDLFTLRA